MDARAPKKFQGARHGGTQVTGQSLLPSAS